VQSGASWPKLRPRAMMREAQRQSKFDITLIFRRFVAVEKDSSRVLRSYCSVRIKHDSVVQDEMYPLHLCPTLQALPTFSIQWQWHQCSCVSTRCGVNLSGLCLNLIRPISERFRRFEGPAGVLSLAAYSARFFQPVASVAMRIFQTKSLTNLRLHPQVSVKLRTLD
jgi:hypothetical protein